jgi:GntR family transcriptional regulator
MVCCTNAVTREHTPGGLRKELGVPLYHQIQHLLRHRIHSGLYRPGTQIPSEHDLSRELAVSRVTLREALRELVRENLLVKVQGKGTFVTSNPPKRLARVRYTGFLEELQERVRKLRVTDVDVSAIPATSELKTALGLDEAVTELTLIKRLRHIDDEPFSYTLNYLPTEIGARIRTKDLYSLPLLKILQEDLKIPIVRAHETIEAAPADPDTARRLAIPVLYPVLHMTRTMFTSHDRPFELVDIFYRADKYHYSVNLTRVKRQGAWTWTTEVETSA